MTISDLLVRLKTNLQIVTDYMDEEARTAKDTELTQYLEVAQRFIKREGITLSLDDIGDCELVVMYAAWLYDKRKVNVSYGNEVKMPNMLRWNLNNRVFQEKINGAG